MTAKPSASGSRMHVMLLALVALIALGVVAVFVAGPAASPGSDDLARAPTGGAGTAAQMNVTGNVIRAYLLKNPEVLEEAINVLQDRRISQAITQHWDDITDAGDSFVAGNPNGDVTMVEFFDYRCPYCKQVQDSIVKLREGDPKLRVIYKEFPILSEESKVAAHAAIASRKQGKYLAFHDALMAARGNFSTDMIMSIAKKVGLDTDKLQKDMKDPAIDGVINRTLQLASEIGVTGTPGFIFGKKLVPGAISYDEMLSLVADARSTKDGTQTD
jgi:protein-disulfide isomerase